ncbi:hypothetical protein DPMN_104530 [Dreissena polymorpha]|uniref:Uncharacterized protein n=1 Tax=Dreissena polymorpha TaxID=45954 RepID=A0A9D4HC74_DREPO|nr:hypothetical protein DPMN_104530 [Dreissena polymorpha]
MSAGGRRGSAKHFRNNFYTRSLLSYAVLRPISWHFRHNAWPKWKAQPLISGSVYTWRRAFHRPASKSTTNDVTFRSLRRVFTFCNT